MMPMGAVLVSGLSLATIAVRLFITFKPKSVRLKSNTVYYKNRKVLKEASALEKTKRLMEHREKINPCGVMRFR